MTYQHSQPQTFQKVQTSTTQTQEHASLSHLLQPVLITLQVQVCSHLLQVMSFQQQQKKVTGIPHTVGVITLHKTISTSTPTPQQTLQKTPTSSTPIPELHPIFLRQVHLQVHSTTLPRVVLTF